MMKTSQVLLLLIAAVMPAGAAVLYGMVYDLEGVPAAGALIELYAVPPVERTAVEEEEQPAEEALPSSLDLEDHPWLFTEEADYSITTDDEGHYRLQGIEAGLYDLVCHADYYEPCYNLGLELVPGVERHLNFALYPLPEVEKPNIYLYPVETEPITVALGFPAGGGVTVSEPEYEHLWRVFADPDGTLYQVQELHWDSLDGSGHALEPRPEPTCDYLFYEAAAPDVWQRERGWVVERENLEAFFRENLTTTGFYANEIADFVEWWLPRLETHPYYALYPQYNAGIAEAVELALSPEPHSLIRLYYVVEGLAEPVELPPATIPAFESGGFTVHEWGVVRDGDLR
jgi:hypothetical protein